MKVSFPHMGCVTAYGWLMRQLGHEVIMPQRPTQYTMELGVKYSPEFICFPFKVMMGTYIECAEAGVETIVTSGGCGPCRAGMYPDVHQKVLDELGYHVRVIVFDSIFKDFHAFYEKLKLVLGGNSVPRLSRLAWLTFTMMKRMDALEKQMKIERAYEKNMGDYSRAWEKIKGIFSRCETRKDIKNAEAEARAIFDAIPKVPVKEQDRIRVGIVGEIYVIMEAAVNKNVEEILNNLGIEVENVQYISDWMIHNLTPKWLPYPKSRRVMKLSNHITPINSGGHDKENMGWVYDFASRSFDGVVHLMPFACLPELVNLGKFPAVSKELGLPILSLSLDEQMGEAHVKTRLEAFGDLIRFKHKAKRQSAVKTAVKPAKQTV